MQVARGTECDAARDLVTDALEADAAGREHLWRNDLDLLGFEILEVGQIASAVRVSTLLLALFGARSPLVFGRRRRGVDIVDGCRAEHRNDLLERELKLLDRNTLGMVGTRCFVGPLIALQ